METKKALNSLRNLTMKEKLIILAAAGVLILLVFLPDGSSKSRQTDKTETNTALSASAENSDNNFLYLQEYTDYLENRLLTVLRSVEGIGEMEVMITLKSSEEQIGEKNEVKKTIMPEIEGVVIACTGGDSAVVVEEITEAVQALFSVQSHKIKVLKKS